mmetsp:Transcript_7413/g.19030  ORF Transcript_7413/g.19030 Transcript_7413/m.19030 type:complete len:347 (+) Transcript_7413:382-1422(+)
MAVMECTCRSFRSAISGMGLSKQVWSRLGYGPGDDDTEFRCYPSESSDEEYLLKEKCRRTRDRYLSYIQRPDRAAAVRKISVLSGWFDSFLDKRPAQVAFSSLSNLQELDVHQLSGDAQARILVQLPTLTPTLRSLTMSHLVITHIQSRDATTRLPGTLDKLVELKLLPAPWDAVSDSYLQDFLFSTIMPACPGIRALHLNSHSHLNLQSLSLTTFSRRYVCGKHFNLTLDCPNLTSCRIGLGPMHLFGSFGRIALAVELQRWKRGCPKLEQIEITFPQGDGMYTEKLFEGLPMARLPPIATRAPGGGGLHEYGCLALRLSGVEALLTAAIDEEREKGNDWWQRRV